MAGRQKTARDLRATLCFTDETGFLLSPLIRTTLAPTGRTPLLLHRARRRDKVSAAAALLLSPSRGHVRLCAQTFPDAYVDAAAYGFFLGQVLRSVRGPLVVVHDNGNMHRGDPVRELCDAAGDRLRLFNLPPYAPELNPVEYLWNGSKDKELANFAPRDVPELDAAASACLAAAGRDQSRLRSFFASSPLPWQRTGFFGSPPKPLTAGCGPLQVVGIEPAMGAEPRRAG